MRERDRKEKKRERKTEKRDLYLLSKMFLLDFSPNTAVVFRFATNLAAAEAAREARLGHELNVLLCVTQERKKWLQCWRSCTDTLTPWSSTQACWWRSPGPTPSSGKPWWRWEPLSPSRAWWETPSVPPSTGNQAPSEAAWDSTSSTPPPCRGLSAITSAARVPWRPLMCLTLKRRGPWSSTPAHPTHAAGTSTPPSFWKKGLLSSNWYSFRFLISIYLFIVPYLLYLWNRLEKVSTQVFVLI